MNGLYFLDKKLDAKGEEIIDQENTNTKEEWNDLFIMTDQSSSKTTNLK
jgi:hypothetical protein